VLFNPDVPDVHYPGSAKLRAVPPQNPGEDVPSDGAQRVSRESMRFMTISMNFLCAHKNALGSSGMKTLNKSVNQEIKINNWIPLISMISLCISRNLPDSSDRKKKIREYRRVSKKT
jgi:hypothetical protein